MAGSMIRFIRVLESKPVDLSIRRWREVRKGTMRIMGLHWHSHMLPEHFKPTAAHVYHYRWRRSKSYAEKKRQGAAAGRFGKRIVDPRAATDALTFSGTLRRNVLQIASIQAFEQRFKLIMPGTSYTPERPRRPTELPLAQEVTRLLEREKQTLSKIGKAHAVEQLKS